MHPDFVCVCVLLPRGCDTFFFIYLSCFDLVVCSFSCNQWLEILKHGFWRNLYCVGVGPPMPLDCYRALREYVCLFVIPVQWRTAALCRSYEDACSTCYEKFIHRVADNDLRHYAFYEKRNTSSAMNKYCTAFNQGMCKSHMPTDASPGASGGKKLLQIVRPL